MVADELDYVVGVDTHLDEHGHRCVVRRGRRTTLDTSERPRLRCGVSVRGGYGNGARVWAIEGTGSYEGGFGAEPAAVQQQEPLMT